MSDFTFCFPDFDIIIWCYSSSKVECKYYKTNVYKSALDMDPFNVDHDLDHAPTVAQTTENFKAPIT
jgi:hypothetical protein